MTAGGLGLKLPGMKDIKVTVPDKVYDRATRKARERSTSLPAVLAGVVQQWAGEPLDFERRRRLQEEVFRCRQEFSARDRLSRDEAHERGSLR